MLSIGKTWFNITKKLIILRQLDLKHIHKVNFYPSDNNFTQALLVTLVTNMNSAPYILHTVVGQKILCLEAPWADKAKLWNANH